jgi:hypothetical protein
MKYLALLNIVNKRKENIIIYVFIQYFIFKLTYYGFPEPFNSVQSKPCSVHHGDLEAGINDFGDETEQHCC